MKSRIFTLASLALTGALALPMAAQDYNCNPQPCYNNGCSTSTPCVTQTGETAPCYIPEMGCGYENCNYPALVERYAYLAHKYNGLGPSERQAAIANNDAEVAELQRLDNHFAQNSNPEGLTPEHLLTLRTAQGTVRR